MLRHLVGLLAGIALAPVLWIAVAWAATQFPLAAEGEVSFATVSSVPVLCLVGIGGGFLVASRLSPLYAASSGALLTALALWPVVSPDSVASTLGWLDREGFVYPAGAGLTPALAMGTLLLFSAMLPARWRSQQESAGPAGGRVVAGVSREQFRREADGGDTLVQGASDRAGADGYSGRSGGSGDTVDRPVTDDLPDTPPVPLPPPGRGFQGDPDKTTTPFRRGETGAVWTPLDEDPEDIRAYRDGRG